MRRGLMALFRLCLQYVERKLGETAQRKDNDAGFGAQQDFEQPTNLLAVPVSGPGRHLCIKYSLG